MNAYMPGEAWRKSSHSGANNDCIEVGGRPGAVAVRDTKDPHGPALAFAPAVWDAFTAELKDSAPGRHG